MKRYKKVARLRKKAGLTQKMMGNRLGISKQYVWDLEDGRKNLSYKLAFKIGKILDAKPDDIFLKDSKRK